MKRPSIGSAPGGPGFSVVPIGSTEPVRVRTLSEWVVALGATTDRTDRGCSVYLPSTSPGRLIREGHGRTMSAALLNLALGADGPNHLVRSVEDTVRFAIDRLEDA